MKLTLFLLAAALSAQTMHMNVLVHAKGGAAISGLKKDDFELWDGGARQEIASVREVKIAPVPALTAAQVAVEKLPNFFTNLVELRRPAPNAVTVILLDELNTDHAGRQHVLEQLPEIARAIGKEDPVAVYVLGRELRVLHDFTDDPATVGAKLEQFRASRNAEGNDAKLHDPFLDQTGGIVPGVDVQRRFLTRRALAGIARHLAGVPGRKSLVWMAGYFPLQLDSDWISAKASKYVTEDLLECIRAVTEESLAIYPVEPHGMSPRGRVRVAPASGRAAYTVPLDLGVLDMSVDLMNSIALRTGGQATYNINDLATPVRNALSEAQNSYVLSYSPSHENWNGKFRGIRVKVRGDGAEARLRSGYFPVAAAGTGGEDRLNGLKAAAVLPLDAAQIGITARLLPDRPEKGNLRLLATIEPRHITLQKKGDRWNGTVDLLFALPGGAYDQVMELHLSQQAYDEAMQQGLVVVRDFKLADATPRIKLIARDVATGHVGSVEMRTDTLVPIAGR